MTRAEEKKVLEHRVIDLNLKLGQCELDIKDLHEQIRAAESTADEIPTSDQLHADILAWMIETMDAWGDFGPSPSTPLGVNVKQLAEWLGGDGFANALSRVVFDNLLDRSGPELPPIILDFAARAIFPNIDWHQLCVDALASKETPDVPDDESAVADVADPEPVATTSFARLVEMRHATCRLGAELHAMQPENAAGYWRQASDGLARTDEALLAIEESMVEWSPDDKDAEPDSKLSPLPSGLRECLALSNGIEDSLSWISSDDILRLGNGEPSHFNGCHIRDFLKMFAAFDGDMRIRQTRPEDGNDHDPRNYIIEDGGGWKLISRGPSFQLSELILMKYLDVDDAGALHVSEKGMELTRRETVTV